MAPVSRPHTFMIASRNPCCRLSWTNLFAAPRSTTSSPLWYHNSTRAADAATTAVRPSRMRASCLALPLRRTYATLVGDPSDSSSSSSSSHQLNWPDAPRGHAHPTPYQILATEQKEPYSKRRFYELVKMYHPDGVCKHEHHDVPHALRLERYRLVVAAHAILSDPTKRIAYDRFGAGWGGVPSAVGNGRGGTAGAAGTPPGPFSGWRDQKDSNIWGNATWEDWERFYARRDGNPIQTPLYLSNSNFILCVVLLAMIGASMNVSRADKAGEKFVAARDAVHDKASKDLRRVRQQSESRPKDERIQFFIRQREASLTGIGVDQLRDDKAAKVLPEQASCMGEGLPAGGRES